MEKRINHSLCGISIAAALLCSLLIFCVMQISATAQMKQAIRESAQTMAQVFNTAQVMPEALQVASKTSQRLTWIAADGTVLHDTAGATQNHADRPEVVSALKNGFGDSTRTSDTLRKQTYYYAIRLADGSVLRSSSTTDSTFSRMLSCIPFVLMALALVTVLSTLAASTITKRIIAPIEAIDVEHPLQNDAYEEFVPLLRRIDRQNKQLGAQLDTVRAMRDDLSDIMENMTEGLAVLSDSGTVLSVNAGALNAVGREKKDILGQPLLALHRDDVFVALTDAVEHHQNLQMQWMHRGRVYRATLSQAARGGSILMLVDETEKCEAEQMRRGFSANVSHELKTPLQSILGTAELLKNGIVKEGDKPAFYANIHRESQRLIALVQDIIDLSRLDEGAQELRKEPVDLLAVARESAQALTEKAAEKQVVITVSGVSATVQGMQGLLGEMVYNLLDNAVSYNRVGGTVSVWVDSTSLTVKDTGIGIPAAHQARVFERFYRVDKSHSRATGGTGLGLSIVKHAAALHGAQIMLQSKENEGTCIVVTFPAG